ncbi:MAG: YraN family protein [Endomicrobia bacterium]|nr:YraN family protein [Endomicrobiia bacterium]
MNTQEVGLYYETLAIKYLKSCKYKILEKNFKTKFGEIDIIAYDKKDNSIVFVEVRYRKNSNYGTPLETVKLYKQKRIAKSAVVYIKSLSKKNLNYRFDIISIIDNGKIEHLKNAFVVDCWYL